MDFPRESPLLEGLNLSNPEEYKGQVDFLLNIQRLLNEGKFVSTYKFALLMAIADLCIEMGEVLKSSPEVKIKQIAEKFIHYYWRQSVPYVPANNAAGRILKQNTGKQAEIISLINRERDRFKGSIGEAKKNEKEWQRILTKTAQLIKKMPLWKLQTIGKEEVPFLYRNAKSGNIIDLLPNIARNFRIFYDLIQPSTRGLDSADKEH